jgi:hypothetical protein
METTIPKKMASGGTVGGSGNTDTVPAMLTPGEFVINKEATAANLPLLQAINGPGGNGPKYAVGGYVPATVANSILSAFKISSRSNKMSRILGNWGMLLPRGINSGLAGNKSIKGAELIKYTKDASRQTSVGDFLNHAGVPPKEIKRIQENVSKKITEMIDPRDSYNDAMLGQLSLSVIDKEIKSLEKRMPGISLAYQKDRMTPGRRDTRKTPRSGETQAEADRRGGGSPTGLRAPGGRASGYRTGTGQEAFAHFTDQAFENNLGLIGQSMGYMSGSYNPAVGGINPNDYSIPSHRRKSFLGMPLNRIGRGWSNPRYIGGSLTHTYQRANRGGMIGMNRGGMVPGYNRGGMIGGMLAQNALPMLGFMGGQSIGTQLGGLGGGMAGGFIGSMLPSMLMGGMGAGRTAPGSDEAYEKYASKLNTSYTANNKFSLSLANSAAQGSKLSKSLMMIVGGITKTNIVLAAGTTALMVGYNAFKNYQKGVELNNSTFGLTAEAAEKAGLKVKDYNSSIKDSISTINATIERNKMLYDSMNSAGVPIKMTIEEYKKLKEEVKVSMSSSIEAINRMKETDLKDYAERLKAQMIAAGASADDAAKKIYAAFALSNKFALAGSSTVGSFGFNNIKDGITAAIEAYKVFNDAVKNESADAQGLALTTSLEAANKAVEEAIVLSQKKADADKSGKTEVISRSQAEIQVLDAIKAKVGTQGRISQGLLDTIISQNKEASKFLSLQDTALSTYQKLRLQAQGYTGDLSMGAVAADRLFSMRAAIESKVTTYSTSQGGSLFGLSQKLKDAQAQYKKLQLASKGASVQQQVDSKKATEAINEKIKKIKEEADARRKALSQQQQDEDFLIQIKKKQLEYQNALATGDMSTAAQAQLDLQSLNKQQQITQATRAIDEKEKLDLKPLEDELKRLSDANQKLSDSAALAGDGLQKLSTDIEKYKTQMSEFIQSLTNFYTFIYDKNNKNKNVEGEAANFLKSAKEAGIVMPDKFDGPRQKSSTELAQEIAERYKDLRSSIDVDTAVITVNSATLNGESVAGENKNRPTGTTGRGGNGYVPPSPQTTTYPKKPEYSPGSYFSYNAPTVPKLHNLNGPVPGPYGKEVSAILKAGTEGVYQEPYINSLKNNQNNTTGGVFNFSSIVNAAEGQDANQIADAVLRKVAQATKEMNTKMGVR